MSGIDFNTIFPAVPEYEFSHYVQGGKLTLADSAVFVIITMRHTKTSHLRHAAGITHVEVDFLGIRIVKDGVSACTGDPTETCTEWANKLKKVVKGMPKSLTYINIGHPSVSFIKLTTNIYH